MSCVVAFQSHSAMLMSLCGVTVKYKRRVLIKPVFGYTWLFANNTDCKYMKDQHFICKVEKCYHPINSGFRRGRGTMDFVICLETEIKKAQVNAKSVMAVFFVIEKAYDMVLEEGFLIKLIKHYRNSRKTYNWIKDFFV